MDAIKKKMQAMKLEKDNAMDRADACEQQAKDANLRAEKVIQKCSKPNLNKKNKETAEIIIGRIVFLLTLPLSRRFVIITITWTFCSQTILQKASHVSINGPWVPIYELLF